MSDTPTIVQALSAVMEDVRAVGKDGVNTSQNYSFRGIDAVVNAVGPLFRKHGIVCLPTVLEASYRDCHVGAKGTPQRECTVRMQYRFYGPAGDSLDATVQGEALDSGDKGTAKAQSVAYRVCLLQALTIPTCEPDPDEFSPVRSTRGADPWDSATAEQIAEATALQDRLEHLPNDIYVRLTNKATKDNGDVPALNVRDVPPTWLGYWATKLAAAEKMETAT